MIEIFKNIIESSVERLLSTQSNILDSTYFTTMTEWNFAHHLSNEIHKYLFWLDNDIEVVKLNYSNKRPDAIFHRRKNNCLNTLVIEIKVRETIDQYDLRKIQDGWMNPPLKYQYGSCLSISDSGLLVGKLFSQTSNLDICHGRIQLNLPTDADREHFLSQLGEYDADDRCNELQSIVEEQMVHLYS